MRTRHAYVVLFLSALLFVGSAAFFMQATADDEKPKKTLIERLYDIPLGAQPEDHAAIASVHRSTVSRRHRRVLTRLRSLMEPPCRSRQRRRPCGPGTSS